MGRLFSYDDIEADKVPYPKDFKLAKNTFESMSAEFISSQLFDGSFIYGSVAVDTYLYRSDFDSVVALSDIDSRGYHAARELYQTIQDETGGRIDLDILARTKQALMEGRHDFDRFFGIHLESEDRSVFGADPSGYMNYAGQNISGRDILASYLSHKKRRFASAFVSANPLDMRENALQRMLELPCAIGRKAVQVFAEVENAEQDLRSVDKAQVKKMARALFARYNLEQGFDELVSADSEYDELLGHTLFGGDVSRHEYEQKIIELHSQLPYVVGWLDKVERTLLPSLDEITSES